MTGWHLRMRRQRPLGSSFPKRWVSVLWGWRSMSRFRREATSLFTRRTRLGSGESNLSLDVMRSRGCRYECRAWGFQAESRRQTAVIHRYFKWFMDRVCFVDKTFGVHIHDRQRYCLLRALDYWVDNKKGLMFLENCLASTLFYIFCKQTSWIRRGFFCRALYRLLEHRGCVWLRFCVWLQVGGCSFAAYTNLVKRFLVAVSKPVGRRCSSV